MPRLNYHRLNGRFTGVVVLETSAVIQACVKAAVHVRAGDGAVSSTNGA